jgi:LPS O-antigen subunit length determinant protein (WzzB/FepE family)
MSNALAMEAMPIITAATSNQNLKVKATKDEAGIKAKAKKSSDRGESVKGRIRERSESAVEGTEAKLKDKAGIEAKATKQGLKRKRRKAQ